mgnify:CR=1 FL=1
MPPMLRVWSDMVWWGAGDGNDGNVDWDISHSDGNISWPRGHANTRHPGETRHRHLIHSDALCACAYCLISPGSLYGVLSLSWIWDVEIDWGNLGLCLVQARQPSPLGHDWPQPPWAGMFLAHDQNWGEFPLTQWINYSPAQCSLAAYWL